MNQGIHVGDASGKPEAFLYKQRKMLILLLSIMVAAVSVKAQPVDLVSVEAGLTADLDKRPSLYTHLSYSTPIGLMRFEAGGIALFGRDGGFGFDVLVARPVEQFEPFFGARFLVWEQSMSTGFPLGIRWKTLAPAPELTLGLSVAPTIHLIAGEKNTIIFDTFIGVRF